MSSKYNAYLEYLSSFADSHTLAVDAEENVYPLFHDIKRLIEHYSSTITKFPTVQKELVSFVEGMSFDNDDFDYYQYKFKELITIDTALQELKGKQVSPKLATEIQQFISVSYRNTSINSNLRNVEEQVLAKINYTYDLKRGSGCLSVILLFIVAAVILSFTIIKQ